MTFTNQISAALYSIKESIADIPEQLEKIQHVDIDHCTHIGPIITAGYTLQGIINQLDHAKTIPIAPTIQVLKLAYITMQQPECNVPVDVLSKIQAEVDRLSFYGFANLV